MPLPTTYPNANQAYRHHLIRVNPLTGNIWVEKDGVTLVHSASTVEHAMAEIDSLMETPQTDPQPMTLEEARGICAEADQGETFLTATLLEAEAILDEEDEAVPTFTPIPNSLSTNPQTAAAQLAIRIERAEKAQAEQHATNATGFEARAERFEAVAASFENTGIDEVTAREMAVDFIDAAEDFKTAAMVAREIAIATHQDDEGRLNSPNGAPHQRNQRQQSNLWGMNRKAQS